MFTDHSAYEHSWRPNPNLLWFLASLIWVVGFLFEFQLDGAFAASGGIAIALTAPFFVFGLSKQSVFEWDLRLALLNQKREAAKGEAILAVLSEDQKVAVRSEITQSNNYIQKTEPELQKHRAYSRGLLVTQTLILSISSIVWSTGTWIGNFFVNCGSLTC